MLAPLCPAPPEPPDSGCRGVGIGQELPREDSHKQVSQVPRRVRWSWDTVWYRK